MKPKPRALQDNRCQTIIFLGALFLLKILVFKRRKEITAVTRLYCIVGVIEFSFCIRNGAIWCGPVAMGVRDEVG